MRFDVKAILVVGMSIICGAFGGLGRAEALARSYTNTPYDKCLADATAAYYATGKDLKGSGASISCESIADGNTYFFCISPTGKLPPTPSNSRPGVTIRTSLPPSSEQCTKADRVKGGGKPNCPAPTPPLFVNCQSFETEEACAASLGFLPGDCPNGYDPFHVLQFQVTQQCITVRAADGVTILFRQCAGDAAADPPIQGCNAYNDPTNTCFTFDSDGNPLCTGDPEHPFLLDGNNAFLDFIQVRAECPNAVCTCASNTEGFTPCTDASFDGTPCYESAP